MRAFPRLPRAPPPCPLSNQRRERTFGPRDPRRAAAAAAAESSARRRWGRVTCVHTVGLSNTPAVVKCKGLPLFRTSEASSEKLIGEVCRCGRVVKRFFLLVLG